MIRLLSALLALTLVAAPALAADDGGFGTDRFYDEAPAALNDPQQGFDPQAVEPAAGDETGVDGQMEDPMGNEAGASTEPSADDAVENVAPRATVIDMEPSAE